MKFTKEFLQELDEMLDAEIVESKVIGTGRWSIRHRCVFKFGGKFYLTHYSRGATEMQDEQPYEYDEDMIECPEVVPVEKTVVVYEVAK
jgi:hypothetical protein